LEDIIDTTSKFQKLTVFPRSPRYRFVPEKPTDFMFWLINLNMPAQMHNPQISKTSHRLQYITEDKTLYFFLKQCRRNTCHFIKKGNKRQKKYKKPE
jgi:hypothetical protein